MDSDEQGERVLGTERAHSFIRDSGRGFRYGFGMTSLAGMATSMFYTGASLCSAAALAASGGDATEPLVHAQNGALASLFSASVSYFAVPTSSQHEDDAILERFVADKSPALSAAAVGMCVYLYMAAYVCDDKLIEDVRLGLEEHSMGYPDRLPQQVHDVPEPFAIGMR